MQILEGEVLIEEYEVTYSSSLCAPRLAFFIFYFLFLFYILYFYSFFKKRIFPITK